MRSSRRSPCLGVRKVWIPQSSRQDARMRRSHGVVSRRDAGIAEGNLSLSPCFAWVTIFSATCHFTPICKFLLCRPPPPLVQGEGIDSIIRLLFLGTHSKRLDP